MHDGIPKLERIFVEGDLEKLFKKEAQVGGAGSANFDPESSDDDESITQEAFETFFARNNVIPSMPIALNFSKRETLLEIFEYLIRVADEQVQKFESDPQ